MARELVRTNLLSDANLVNYWQFEGNANSSAGSVNNGTATNITYGNQYGRFKQGAYFNGTSRIDFSSITYGSTGSILFWFNVASTANKQLVDGVEANKGLNVQIFSNSVYYAINDGTFINSSAISANTWYHCVITWDSGANSRKLYLNGLEVASGTAATPTATGLKLGMSNDNANGVTGSFDDLAVFSKVLSPGEIAQLYTGTKELYTSAYYSDSGLVAYYRLEGNSNDSKNSYNGTDTAISYGNTYGIFGQGANFNGSTSTIQVANKLVSHADGANFTFGCWVKPSSTANGSYVLSLTGTENNKQFTIDMPTNTTISAYHYGTSVQRVSGSFSCVNDGSTWYHVVLVKVGTTIYFYANGALVGSVGISGTIDLGAINGLGIGRHNGTTANWLTGSVDDVFVFNRALSAGEIWKLYSGVPVTELYSTPLFSDANIVSYYRLEGNSNDSKSTNNGTDSNATYNVNYGVFGQGLYCNGSSTKILLGDSPFNFQTDFSYSFWYFPPVGVTDSGYLVSRTTGSSPYVSYLVYGNTSNSGFVFQMNNTGAGATNCINACGFVTGRWYHLVAVVEGTNLKLYVDGSPGNSSSTFSGSRISNSIQTSIGMRGTDSVGAVNGYIDDVAFFSRALTANEVYNIYYGTWSSIKTINGLAKGSVKTVNGLAIASVKSINSLT